VVGADVVGADVDAGVGPDIGAGAGAALAAGTAREVERSNEPNVATVTRDRMGSPGG